MSVLSSVQKSTAVNNPTLYLMYTIVTTVACQCAYACSGVDALSDGGIIELLSSDEAWLAFASLTS